MKRFDWAVFVGYIAVVAFAATMIVTAPGCATLAAGQACSGNAAYCQSPKEALACEDGKLSAFACPGSEGCQESDGGVVTCDQSANVTPGMPCPPAYNGTGQCSADSKSLLVCQGTWTAVACPAGTTCQSGNTGVGCI